MFLAPPSIFWACFITGSEAMPMLPVIHVSQFRPTQNVLLYVPVVVVVVVVVVAKQLQLQLQLQLAQDILIFLIIICL